ncbi:uncharacterized protein LOC131168645 [Malania oleifera]|uniref:uncharacterized protein LOC131168645 n=1 Tax=Malania oleifera TaxID=397392 RepID=UPI0025AE1F71|nr:uncharacterized protein LOC131168645 [Malania oleifera]
MVALGKRTRTLELPANPNHHIDNGQNQTTEAETISAYELSREKRIKENLQRMEKLGIFDLSAKLKSVVLPTPKNPSARRIAARKNESSILSSGPRRRSSRLQNVTPISYSELDMSKKDASWENEDLLREEGSKPEVYGEAHEKVLGNTQKSWTLFVDGCGKDGKRIYDPVKGKTCHQCRQKTLGHRTHCSKCNMVQGQFCGDCLFMRYGEHVLEAKENPNWICPVCRGICNCSLCRQAKGWAPTGPLYRKISKLGFKSVAHYLIQTQRLDARSGKDTSTNSSVSARRSLPFSDIDALSKSNEFPMSNSDHHGLLKAEVEEKNNDGLNKEEKMKHFSDRNILSGISPTLKKKAACATESSADSVAGRLRQRKHSEGNDHNHKELATEDEEETLDDKFSANKSSENKTGFDMKLLAACEPKKKAAHITEPSPDSIAGRLRQRRMKGNDLNGGSS